MSNRERRQRRRSRHGGWKSKALILIGAIFVAAAAAISVGASWAVDVYN
jgi:hypothetical protein